MWGRLAVRGGLAWQSACRSTRKHLNRPIANRPQVANPPYIRIVAGCEDEPCCSCELLDVVGQIAGVLRRKTAVLVGAEDLTAQRDEFREH